MQYNIMIPNCFLLTTENNKRFVHLLKVGAMNGFCVGWGLMDFCCFVRQPVTPSRPPMVVDWAPGVAPKPDPRTISKHVQRMVDVSASFFPH